MVLLVVVMVVAGTTEAVVKVGMSLAAALVDAQVMAAMQEVKRVGTGSFLQQTLLVAVPLEEAVPDQEVGGLEELCLSLTVPLEALCREQDLAVRCLQQSSVRCCLAQPALPQEQLFCCSALWAAARTAALLAAAPQLLTTAARPVVPGSQVQAELEELVHQSGQPEARAELGPKEQATMVPRGEAMALN